MSIGVFQFGEYRLDGDRFELLRAGRSLRLERKPMELLILLASRRGELVSREEIAERLWGRHVFVDSEHGINTAIRKIRYVLRDDSERPRFIQTVTGKGYRFAGTVEEVPKVIPLFEALNGSLQGADAQRDAADISAGVGTERPHQDEARPAARKGLTMRLGVAGAAVVFLAALLIVGVRKARNHSVDGAALTEIHSLAVLPLDNLSGDREQDYFADGMTDELTTMLAKDSTLRIVSRTSAMQYKGAHRPLREIAEALGVDGVVEGSVERSGGEVHMTLQLIQGSSDTHLWAESYNRDASDAVSLPDEAAMVIARKTNSAVARRTPPRYVNPVAHDAYLHGRYLWIAGRNDEAEKYFSKAVTLDPDYALAWTGVADYYDAGMMVGVLDPRRARQPAEDAAEKAVALDDSLPQTHNALCAADYISRWDLARADQECARAIDLDPEFAEAYHLRAKVLIAMNRPDEAIAMQKEAMELDPFARPWGLAYIDLLARQYDAALTEARQRLESDPHNATTLSILARIYRCKRMDAEAAKAWEDSLIADGDAASAESIRRAFARGGYAAVLRRKLADLKKQALQHYVSPVDLALQSAQLGERNETLSLLEEGYRQHSPQLLENVQSDPAFDFLHGDTRYRAMIKEAGLPPEY